MLTFKKSNNFIFDPVTIRLLGTFSNELIVD